MRNGLHFPFRFDTVLLDADLATAKAEPWSRHYNERDYGGDWSGIALRSAGGREDQLVAAPPGAGVFEDTPLLARCPYFREVLSVFQCPLIARHFGLALSEKEQAYAHQAALRDSKNPGFGFEADSEAKQAKARRWSGNSALSV